MKESVGVGVRSLHVAKMRYSPASSGRSGSFIIRYQILYQRIKHSVVMTRLGTGGQGRMLSESKQQVQTFEYIYQMIKTKNKFHMKYEFIILVRIGDLK